MVLSLGRSGVLGKRTCDLAESQGSRDFRGRFLPPKPTKNRIRSYPMGRAVITRSYGDIFGIFTGFGGHLGCLCVKRAFFGVLEMNSAIFTPVYVEPNHALRFISKKTLETTLETVKARKNAKIGRQNFGPPMTDEHVALSGSFEAGPGVLMRAHFFGGSFSLQRPVERPAHSAHPASTKLASCAPTHYQQPTNNHRHGGREEVHHVQP